MKNKLNKLLLLALLSLILTTPLVLLAFAIDPHPASIFSNSSSLLPLFFGIFTAFIYTVTLVLFGLIAPLVISGIELISQILARIFQIGKDKKWKYICSIAFSAISVILQICLTNLMLFNIAILSRFMAIPALVLILIDISFIKNFLQILTTTKSKKIALPIVIIAPIIISALFIIIF